MNIGPLLSALILLAGITGLAGPSTVAVAADEAAPFDGALRAAADMPRLNSLLISRGGELVLEEYFNGTDRWQRANVKSVSKSILSALIGIAIEQGVIEGIDQPIADYYGDALPESKHAITIGNLLSMQAGLETTSFYNYGAWVLSDDWVRFALEQPLQSEPGTDMHYSTGNTHLLSDILTRASGMSTYRYASEKLAVPLGFKLAPWPTDPQGVYFGGNDMELTPRQMLAFGELYMNRGRYRGRQVVPADWVVASLTPRARSTRDPDRQYGLGWWMKDMAGLQTAYAWGYGGQFILLVPELELVVVTTSDSLPDSNRRRHTRELYDLLEHEIVAPALRAYAVADAPGAVPAAQ
jgi:CubicO group peptidase (beta-lactamase class C family)